MNTATLIAAGKMNTSCQDVRVLSSDGVTQLSYEIEACNATNTVLWVNIPATTANGNDTVRIYYGANGVADAQNASGVFINETSVWHLASASDSLNANNLTNVSTVTYTATNCKFGKCANLSATAYLKNATVLTGFALVANASAARCWGYLTTGDTNYRAIFSYGKIGTINAGRTIFYHNASGLSEYAADNYGGTVTAYIQSLPKPVAMTYFADIYNGTNRTLYVNTTTNNSKTTTKLNTQSGAGLYIGSTSDGALWARTTTSIIDECRATKSGVIYPADWFIAEYAQTDSITTEQSQSQNDETCVPADHIPECTAPAGWTCGG